MKKDIGYKMCLTFKILIKIKLHKIQITVKLEYFFQLNI